MLLIPIFIAWLASLVGVIAITPLTLGWLGCALLCGILGLFIWPGIVIMGSFDEFTWWLFFPGVVGSVASAGLIIAAIVVPFWRGLGIHEVIVR